ncbi:MAG: hypothetical protein Q8Q46_03730 [Candidatus Giovannonibacteria bacterium]|nr:hypothetical protein [Candidatus Giovannonibacteria bacterium]
MNYIFWILFLSAFGISYWIGFKIKKYWALFLAPFVGIFMSGINLWIYFIFTPLGKTDLAGIVGLLIIAPIFFIIIGALDILASLAGVFFGIRKGRKNKYENFG